MNHDRVLALFYGLWAALEIFVIVRRRGGTRQDRGSHAVLWVLVGVAVAGTLFTALLPGESEGRSRLREETRALPEVAKPA